jgi:hypothetical protein
METHDLPMKMLAKIPKSAPSCESSAKGTHPQTNIEFNFDL